MDTQPSLQKPSLLVEWGACLELCLLSRVPSSWHVFWFGTLPLCSSKFQTHLKSHKSGPPAHQDSMLTQGSPLHSPTLPGIKHVGKTPGLFHLPECELSGPRVPQLALTPRLPASKVPQHLSHCKAHIPFAKLLLLS